MDESTKILFAAIGTIPLVVLITGLFAWKLASLKRTAAQPVDTRIGTVQKKGFFQPGGGKSQTTYYIEFDVENGETVRVILSNKDFDLIRESQKGTLETKGEALHRFQPESDGPAVVSTYLADHMYANKLGLIIIAGIGGVLDAFLWAVYLFRS